MERHGGNTLAFGLVAYVAIAAGTILWAVMRLSEDMSAYRTLTAVTWLLAPVPIAGAAAIARSRGDFYQRLGIPEFLGTVYGLAWGVGLHLLFFAYGLVWVVAISAAVAVAVVALRPAARGWSLYSVAVGALAFPWVTVMADADPWLWDDIFLPHWPLGLVVFLSGALALLLTLSRAAPLGSRRAVALAVGSASGAAIGLAIAIVRAIQSLRHEGEDAVITLFTVPFIALFLPAVIDAVHVWRMHRRPFTGPRQ